MSDATMEPKAWAALVRKMGPQALRMNLIALLPHDVLVTGAMVDYVADRIAHDSKIRRSEQFPHDQFPVYMFADDNAAQKINITLRKATEIA